MATQVQRRRGTASEHNTFTGAAGEVTVNTTNDSVHVHDGATAGGFETMRVDGDNSQVPLGPRSIQVFESSGTWTKPSGVNFIKVTVTGGGGGGGPTNNDDMANGGGAGGTSIKIIDVSGISTVAVTVGVGATGTSNSSNFSEGPGGTSSFGSFCSATGGFNNGGNWAIGGQGGDGIGGDININGGDGMGGLIDLTNVLVAAGTGGSSFWGGGGAGNHRIGEAGFPRDGRAFGSGGGGGADTGPSADGADGVVVVEEFA